jgi:hypothetical protein
MTLFRQELGPNATQSSQSPHEGSGQEHPNGHVIARWLCFAVDALSVGRIGQGALMQARRGSLVHLHVIVIVVVVLPGRVHGRHDKRRPVAQIHKDIVARRLVGLGVQVRRIAIPLADHDFDQTSLCQQVRHADSHAIHKHVERLRGVRQDGHGLNVQDGRGECQEEGNFVAAMKQVIVMVKSTVVDQFERPQRLNGQEQTGRIEQSGERGIRGQHCAEIVRGCHVKQVKENITPIGVWCDLGIAPTLSLSRRSVQGQRRRHFIVRGRMMVIMVVVVMMQ